MMYSDTKSVRTGPFIAKIWLFSELDLHFDKHNVEKWAVQKTDTTICLYILPGVVAEGPFYHSVNSDCR